MARCANTPNADIFLLQAGDPGPKNAPAPINAPGKNEGGGLSLGTYSIVVIGGFFAYLAYQYLQQQAETSQQQQA